MTPTHATNNGGKRYRYYVCTSGLKAGTCTGKFIAAPGLEQVVLDQLKGLEDSQASCLTDWDALPPLEQARVVRLLVERVAYDGSAGKLTIAFNENGLVRLKAEQEKEQP